MKFWNLEFGIGIGIYFIYIFTLRPDAGRWTPPIEVLGTDPDPSLESLTKAVNKFETMQWEGECPAAAYLHQVWLTKGDVTCLNSHMPAGCRPHASCRVMVAVVMVAVAGCCRIGIDLGSFHSRWVCDDRESIGLALFLCRMCLQCIDPQGCFRCGTCLQNFCGS